MLHILQHYRLPVKLKTLHSRETNRPRAIIPRNPPSEHYRTLSITKMRGCMQYLGTPVLLIVAILLVVGFLYTPQGCEQTGSLSSGAGAKLTDPILQVGESNAFAAEAYTVVQNLKAQYTQQAVQSGAIPELTPYQYLTIYMQAANNLAQQAAVFELGRTQGIEVDDEDMDQILVQMNEDSLKQQRTQFELYQTMSLGPMEAELAKLKKEKAKPEEIKKIEDQIAALRDQTFDSSFAAQTGTTPAEYVKRQIEDVKARASKEPAIARSIEATAIQRKLTDKYAAGIDTSDNALKASYDKIVFKQIMISGANAESKAKEVLAKVKGGLDFDQAVKQFSMLKKPDGTVQTDSTTETRIDMLSNELWSPMLTMKAGEVSEVVPFGDSHYVFKVIAVRADAPADLAGAKAARIEQLKSQQVNAKLNEAIAGMIGKTGEKVKWTEPAFQLLADYMNSAQSEDQVAALTKIIEDSRDLTTNFAEIAPIIRFAAINQLQVEVKDPVKKKELDAQLLETYDSIITIAPSVDLRFQYVSALIAAGKGDRALELLLDNAQGATPPSETTEPIIKRVESLLPKAANLATKGSELVAEVQEEIRLWHAELADRKKADEELKKQNAAEEAELKKKEAAAPKTTAPGATTPAPTPAKPEPSEPKPPGSGG